MNKYIISYDDIVSINKIKDVYDGIYKNTCHKAKLVRFELTKTSNIVKIYNTLKNKHYNHLKYNIFIIQEPKYRIIMSELMYDKIVNHLISKYVLIPTLSRKLIEQNVATRTGKGSKEGIRYMKKYINSIKENYDNVYILKCDISKYFYNIDHEILINKLSHENFDKDILRILINIISSTNNDYINDLIDSSISREISHLEDMNIYDLEAKKKQLYSLPRYRKGKGLPIGNETSQLLAIYYLNELDHYIKEQLHIKYYVRYMDDFILIHHDKEYLKKCLNLINKKLSYLKLSFNKKTQIYNLKSGVNFLGYKFILKNKKLVILLNNQTRKKIKRKLRKARKNNINFYKKSLASYNGYFKVSTTNNFVYKNKFFLEEGN